MVSTPCYNVGFLNATEMFWIDSAYPLIIGTKYSGKYWKMKAQTYKAIGN